MTNDTEKPAYLSKPVMSQQEIRAKIRQIMVEVVALYERVEAPASVARPQGVVAGYRGSRHGRTPFRPLS